MSNAFKLTFWGVRGSLPVSGPETQRYGGDTSAIEISCGDECIVLDLGSGARAMGDKLVSEGHRNLTALITHGHYDHIMGLPFFAPLRRADTSVTLASAISCGTAYLVDGLLRPPYFPIGRDNLGADISYRDLAIDGAFDLSKDIRISHAPTRHHGGSTAYRIDAFGRSVTYVGDHEIGDAVVDARLLDLAKNSDLVILDATGASPFAHGEAGYGHSSWQEALDFGRDAGAKRIALTHHHPASTDDGLDRLAAAVGRLHDGAFVARVGQTIDLFE